MHKKLFIPGPVEVRKEVLEKMATPMIGHRGKDASDLQRRISNNLRKLFYTQNEILLSVLIWLVLQVEAKLKLINLT